MLRRGAVLLVALATVAGAQARAADPAAGGLLLVANKGDHTLGIIDPVAGRQVATVKQSGVDRPRGRRVPGRQDGLRADLRRRRRRAPRLGRPDDGRDRHRLAPPRGHDRLRRPKRPHCAVFGPDGRLYVTAEVTHSIKVVDPRTNTVVDTLPPTRRSRTCSSFRATAGPPTRRTWARGRSASSTSRRRRSRPWSPWPPGRSASPSRRTAASLFTADQDNPRLAVIDTKTNKLAPGVALPGVAYGTAPTPDGRFLVMALPGSTRWASST